MDKSTNIEIEQQRQRLETLYVEICTYDYALSNGTIKLFLVSGILSIIPFLTDSYFPFSLILCLTIIIPVLDWVNQKRKIAKCAQEIRDIEVLMKSQFGLEYCECSQHPVPHIFSPGKKQRWGFGSGIFHEQHQEERVVPYRVKESAKLF